MSKTTYTKNQSLAERKQRVVNAAKDNKITNFFHNLNLLKDNSRASLSQFDSSMIQIPYENSFQKKSDENI